MDTGISWGAAVPSALYISRPSIVVRWPVACPCQSISKMTFARKNVLVMSFLCGANVRWGDGGNSTFSTTQHEATNFFGKIFLRFRAQKADSANALQGL